MVNPSIAHAYTYRIFIINLRLYTEKYTMVIYAAVCHDRNSTVFIYASIDIYIAERCAYIIYIKIAEHFSIFFLAINSFRPQWAAIYLKVNEQ